MKPNPSFPCSCGVGGVLGEIVRTDLKPVSLKRGEEVTDRQIITSWLDRIGETDHSIVIRQCTEDKSAREYYKGMALGEYGDTNAGIE